MEAISNIDSYTKEMAKGMEDKIFFLDFLPKDRQYTFVDFGCADGTLINLLHHILGSEHLFIGYDNSEQMIELARTKISDSPENIVFTTDWNNVSTVLKCENRKTILILSSVIHEIYSYGTSESISKFWKNILDTKFDYICVRDMMLPENVTYLNSCLDWIDNIQFSRVPTLVVKQFTDKWGSLENKKNVLHFLLKYRWQINWQRELNENYFPISIEELLDHFKENYNLDYFIRFRIPFLDECIKKDFFITFEDSDSTHIKAIFSKKIKNG